MKKVILYFLVPSIIFISLKMYAQEDGITLLQNLAAEQVSAAKKGLKNDSLNISPDGDSSTKEQTLKENCFGSEAGCENEEKSIYQNSKKFGYDFIATTPTSIVATVDLPLPNEYQISLGDLIGVVLSGSKEQIFDLKVQLDGTVLFPELGAISVAGETFLEIKNKFRNLIDQSYIGVNIDLSLKDLSAKKITIVGAVNNPGTYLVNPFTTISNSLAYSGGVKDIGSLRNIQLLRLNGNTYGFDLYDLLINGDRTNDITIASGDVIIVGAATKSISIFGAVKRPGIYEIIPGEDLSDLIDYALGFSGGANINKITLDKLVDNSTILKVITSNIEHSLEDILSVNIYPYVNYNNSSILVMGAVKEPGYYKLEDYESLEDIINELDFVNVYPWLATLEQFDEDNLIKSSVLFNLKDPSTYKSIKLLPNSRLYFTDLSSRTFNVNPVTDRLISEYNLTINHKQGTFNLPVFGGYSVKSFIDFLGKG